MDVPELNGAVQNLVIPADVPLNVLLKKSRGNSIKLEIAGAFFTSFRFDIFAMVDFTRSKPNSARIIFRYFVINDFFCSVLSENGYERISC